MTKQELDQGIQDMLEEDLTREEMIEEIYEEILFSANLRVVAEMLLERAQLQNIIENIDEELLKP